MKKLNRGWYLAVLLTTAAQLCQANENVLENVVLKYQYQVSDGCSDDLNPVAIKMATKANQDYWVKGKSRDAAKQLEQAIALEPRLYTGYANLKFHYCWALKQCEKAVDMLNSAIKHCPLWPGHHQDLAAVYSKMGKHDLALKEYTKAQTKGIKETASLFYNIGNAQGRLELYKEAIINFQKALKLDPRHFNAHKNLIVTFAMLNDTEKARKQIQILLSLKPDQETVSWANNAKRRLSQ